MGGPSSAPSPPLLGPLLSGPRNEKGRRLGRLAVLLGGPLTVSIAVNAMIILADGSRP